VDKNEGEKIGYVEFTDLAEMPGEGKQKWINDRSSFGGSVIDKCYHNFS